MMRETRTIKKVWKSKPTIEGAGVHPFERLTESSHGQLLYELAAASCVRPGQKQTIRWRRVTKQSRYANGRW